MIKIDGTTYDVPVISLTRKADFLDKYAKRTEDGDMQRELIGVYFNYQLKLGVTLDRAEYQRFWDKITEPKEFHQVTLPDEGGEYTFTAYVSNVSDELLLQDSHGNTFKGTAVNFTAKSPARK